MLTQILHKRLGQVNRNLVCGIVVVAERHIGALLYLIVDSKAVLVTHNAHLAVLHGSNRVGNDRQTGNARSACALHIAVMERHLKRLIVILVVHVVDNLQSVHIGLRQPTHHLLKLRHKLLVGEIVARDGREAWAHLMSADLVAAAVDGVEHTLGEVGTRSEELHLLADLHRRHAACYAVVVAQLSTHKVVVLILYGTRVDAYLCTIFLPRLWQALAPQHREVWLGRGTHVIKRVEEAIVGLCNHRASVDAHTSDRGCCPDGIAREQVVILGCAQEAHNAQLHDHLVNKLLRLLLCERAVLQVALNEDVKERAHTAQRHGGTILVLNRTKVAKIGPLHSLTRVGGGL